MKKNITNLLLIGILFLTGCVHFKPKPVFKYIPWQKRQVELRQNKNWNISGSLSVTHGKKRDVAHFEWEQNQNNYTINISGPMNLNRVKIIGDAKKVLFCRSNNQCVLAKSPETLFFNLFGWRLPISNIHYWISTLPAPTKVQATHFDQYGHLIELVQNGWRINYFEFKSVKNIDLPSVIELRNNNFFIKLKIIKFS
jgi:outer membrane lipoprotein LolB